MKRMIVILVVLAVSAVALTLAAAQERTEQTSMLDNARIYVEWMRAMSDRLEKALDEARVERNRRKIDCIEDRLNSLGGLIAESEGLAEKIRAFSLQQRTAEMSRLFARLEHNRGIAMQLLELVDSCFHSINEEGGFVETIEEWMGDPEQQPEDDPSASEDPPVAPEPVPSEFTPGPVSEEDELS